jgi:hypothetical protein
VRVEVFFFSDLASLPEGWATAASVIGSAPGLVLQHAWTA